MEMKQVVNNFSDLGITIFTVMSALAQEHEAINLGQGFPDDEGLSEIREVAAKALIDGPNQYPPMMGIAALRHALVEHEKRFYGLEFDWQSEVMVTSGATEALAASLLGLLAPGDEVVLLEPLYDCYLPIIRQAGAVPRFVRLMPHDNGGGWHFDEDELRAAFSDRTKLIVLNSPMNPTGKVFSLAELSLIAELVDAYDCYAVCDEVYEHLTFDDAAHIPLMTLPGMADRCLRIGSAGKTFSLTGWKVGYVTGPAALVSLAAKVHQFLTFTTPPNLQAGVAHGLAMDDGFYRSLRDDMAAKRDLLTAGLIEAGFSVQPSHGTYFVNADFAPLLERTKPGDDDFDGSDTAFCRLITEQAKVAAIPVSAFYHSGAPKSLIRFCFCKNDDTLRQAVDRLSEYFR